METESAPINLQMELVETKNDEQLVQKFKDKEHLLETWRSVIKYCNVINVMLLIAMMVRIFRLFIVCSSPISNVLCFSQHFSLGHSCICDVTMFLLLRDCLPC